VFYLYQFVPIGGFLHGYSYMPFFKLDDIDNLESYKKSRQAALSRIGEKPVSFIYSKNHSFKLPQKKTAAIFVFEAGRIDSKMIAAVKAGTAGTPAEGTCYKSPDGALIFELTKGNLAGFDMVPKFQVGAPTAAESKPEPAEEQAKAEAAPKDAPKPEAGGQAAPTPEEEEESADLKVRLTNALKKVRTADGKEAIAFVACVAKPFYGLLLAKNATEKIGPTHKQTLTQLTQATKFTVGTCLFENNAHTFVVESVPSGLAKGLRDTIKEHTGQAYKVRVRDAESKVVTDGDTDTDVAEASPRQAPTAPPPSPPSPPPPSAKAAPSPPGQPGVQPKEIKLSTYLSGRANLRLARETSEKELRRLQQAILAKSKDEPFFQEVETKSQKLFDYLVPIDDSVVNKLDEAGKCPDPELQLHLNQKVRELIQQQLTSLRSHALATFVEKNPFGKFIVKQPLEVTLSALDKQLS